MPYHPQTALLPPLDIYDQVFWRLISLVLWVMAYFGPVLAIAAFVSLFADGLVELHMRGRPVRSVEDQVGMMLSSAFLPVVGHALLPRLPNAKNSR